MFRKILKWGAIVILILVVIGAAYLAAQPDPGPYLIALRSDTPEQVSKSLDAILASDTIIHYDGYTYPAPTTEQLQVLGMRLFGKATGQSREPLRGDTATWVGFAGRVGAAIQSRIRNP